MKTYLAGTQVKLSTETFTDPDGNPLEVVSATYKIVDDTSKELQGTTALDVDEDFILISAEVNTLSSTIDFDKLTSETMDDVRLFEGRIVEFELTLKDGNVTPYDLSYMIAPREKLIAGLNSFQSLRESYLTALSIPNTTAWTTASEEDRIAAMIEARLRICAYQFSDVTLGQSYLGQEVGISDLSRLPPKEFAKLTSRFRKALRLAQVAEADELLGGGDQASSLRRDGLISQTIGETQEVYRNSKPISLQVSKATLRYLSQYISLNKRVGRS